MCVRTNTFVCVRRFASRSLCWNVCQLLTLPHSLCVFDCGCSFVLQHWFVYQGLSLCLNLCVAYVCVGPLCWSGCVWLSSYVHVCVVCVCVCLHVCVGMRMYFIFGYVIVSVFVSVFVVVCVLLVSKHVCVCMFVYVLVCCMCCFVFVFSSYCVCLCCCV